MKLAISAFFLLTAAPVFAGAISIGQWYTGSWLEGGAGTTVGACSGVCPYVASAETFEDPGTGPWTFVAGSGGALLTVTDLQFDGDSFTINDFGAFVGNTNGIVSTYVECELDGVVCLADAAFSHGTFLFGPGAHSLSIVVLAQTNGFVDGSVAFRLDGSAVPEPATFGLMGLGLAGLMAARKRFAR
ncbi:MAG: PEP-CTERM sorting domain-containing protein [Acidobacteriota bacterium]